MQKTYAILAYSQYVYICFENTVFSQTDVSSNTSHSMRNLFQFKLTAFIVLAITTANSFGQNSKKETTSRYKQITSLSLDQIKSKKYSKLARELTIENFMIYYIENGKETFSKEYGTKYIDSLYNDSVFTYYVHRTQTNAIDFLKVRLNDIGNINISDVDGNLIRKYFIDEIVPKRDKDRVEKKSKNCGMGSEYGNFDYYYDKKSRLIEVKYKWKITCDFIRVINKNYKSYYNLDNKTFQN